jgi:glycosyltransferase involved in cell wall biosynthesis
MSGPRLSVLMPNYNHARFLPAALDAILAQSYRPLELVIVDDGSTDDSLVVLERYQRQAPELIRVIQNERNLGVLPTLQHLVTTAAGEYVYFAAADDLVLPGFFDRCMTALARNPTAGLCSTLTRTMNESGAVQGVMKTPVVLARDGFLGPGEVLAALRRHGSWFNGNATILRRAALVEAGGFRKELGPYCDGFIYGVIALKHGACFVPEPLTVHRRMEGTYSQRVGVDIDAVLRVLDHAERFMRQEYADLFPPDYVEDWKRDMYFIAALPFATSPESGGLAKLERLVPSTSATDRMFHSLARNWPALARTVARPYLFAKLRHAQIGRVILRRLAHARLSSRSR